MGVESIFFIIILLFSVIIHEVAHGYMAYYLGDTTAHRLGRLTLNPLPHIDLLGSVVVPGVLLLTNPGGILFGWAKPVPFNPNNLRSYKWGVLYVAIAGVMANFFIAIVLSLLIKILLTLGVALTIDFYTFLSQVILINLVLGIFNLIPIPPLDGSKVLFTLLPYKYRHIQSMLEQNWIVGIIVVILVAPAIISPIIVFCYNALLG